jgi:hypothetical protein
MAGLSFVAADVCVGGLLLPYGYVLSRPESEQFWSVPLVNSNCSLRLLIICTHSKSPEYPDAGEIDPVKAIPGGGLGAFPSLSQVG